MKLTHGAFLRFKFEQKFHPSRLELNCVPPPKKTYRASLVVQLVKNPPAMQETWVPSPDCEDPLEEGMATHSSILA